MIRKLKTILVAVALAAIALVPAIAPKPAAAAVTNMSSGIGDVVVIPLHLSGTYSATIAAVAKFKMPFPCKMIGVGSVPNALTGVNNTVDVLLGGVSILSAAMATTAGTYTEGTITTSTITDEGTVSVDLTIPAGTLVDTTVLLTCVRR